MPVASLCGPHPSSPMSPNKGNNPLAEAERIESLKLHMMSLQSKIVWSLEQRGGRSCGCCSCGSKVVVVIVVVSLLLLLLVVFLFFLSILPPVIVYWIIWCIYFDYGQKSVSMYTCIQSKHLYMIYICASLHETLGRFQRPIGSGKLVWGQDRDLEDDGSRALLLGSWVACVDPFVCLWKACYG